MKHSSYFLCILFVFGACANKQSSFTAQNLSAIDQVFASVEIPLSSLAMLPATFELIDEAGKSIPYQLDDIDKDGNNDVLFTLLSVAATSSATFSIKATDSAPTFTKMTHAVIKVREVADPNSMQLGDDFKSVLSYTEPFNFEQDNGLIYLEGPAWESNLVGYRFYFDNRNRFDIFGKSTQEMALASIEENYHELADWGADILKVGSSLGMASPALYENNTLELLSNTGTNRVEVVTSGSLRSILRVYHPEWKTQGHTLDAVTELEIHAHHRYTELRLSVSGIAKDLSFATGLVRHPDAPNLVDLSSDDFAAGYTWGIQTDQAHQLGMAVIVPAAFSPAFNNNDENSHLVAFNSVQNEFRYRFLAAWELEPEEVRITNEADFSKVVEQEAIQMTQPLTITISQ